MTNRLRKNNSLMFKRYSKTAQVSPTATGRGMSHERKPGGAVPTKHRRKQWYEGFPKLKDGKYFSQKFGYNFKDEEYVYPTNPAL